MCLSSIHLSVTSKRFNELKSCLKCFQLRCQQIEMGESALSKTGRILIAIRDYYYVAINAFREDTDEKGIITCILYPKQSDQIQFYD